MSTFISPERMTVQQPQNTLPVQQLRKRTNHYTLYVFFVLFVATLLNGLDSSEFTSASAVIARELHLGISDIGILASAFTNVASLFIMNTHNLVLFSAVMVPAFFINMLHIGPLSAALLDVVPSEQRASAVAISVFIQRILGTALAPLLIGTLASSFDPSGLHFLHNLAGHDLILALVSTCPVAFISAGIVGILGLHWMRNG